MGMFQTTGSNERFGVLESTRQKTFAAAGSAQADATVIGANVNIVTGASGANGVVLRPTKGVNHSYSAVIYSSAATNALLLYPPLGGTINNGTVNAALSLTARKPAYVIATSQIDFIVIAGA